MSSAVSPKNSNYMSSKTKLFQVGSIVPITKSNNSELFLRALEAMCELGFSVSALAEGDKEAQSICFEIAQKYPNNFQIIESLPKNRAQIMNKADVLVFPEVPSDKILKEIIREGIIPVLPQGGKFQNFDPQKESGNAFTFSKSNFWEFLSAIIRASENFKFSYDWQNLQKNLRETEV